MHPRQATVAAEVRSVVSRIAATPPPASPATTGQAVLWKYEDPEGNKFYLEVKKTTVKSPFTGKSFSTRPVKHTPSQVGKEMKDERKEQAKSAAEVDLATYVDRVLGSGGKTVEAAVPEDGGWDDSPISKER